MGQPGLPGHRCHHGAADGHGSFTRLPGGRGGLAGHVPRGATPGTPWTPLGTGGVWISGGFSVGWDVVSEWLWLVNPLIFNPYVLY